MSQTPSSQRPSDQSPYPPHPMAAPSERNPASRNPLGLAALILGAIGPVLGFLFVFVQAAVISSGGVGAIAAVSITQSVLVGLTAIAAVILGIVAISRPGSSKAFASAGLALGAAGVLSVLGALIYPVIVSLTYG
ncbi:hypothetical protein N1027_07410 [Herbiconiux sp. CPCC 205763]|uniref:DUF4190 domain-containing protein n=1 Tax=Herbiconiux aconitum TaxID=2970913 RepID=A0ABT2GQW0_9MICO|nr:hypothetical protein [Herbiconiux aconitum]MCS5717962.1 hypothetical protein [Herbiconiux aconitum]